MDLHSVRVTAMIVTGLLDTECITGSDLYVEIEIRSDRFCKPL